MPLDATASLLERNAQLKQLAEGVCKVAEELVLVLGILHYNLLQLLILDKGLRNTTRPSK